MTALRKSVPLILAAVALVGQAAGARAQRLPGIGGLVRGESSPLSAAHVYAYQITDLSLHQALTDAQGNFLFRDLPAGLYKIIAHKVGFVPRVVPLVRTAARDYQRVEVDLPQRPAGQVEKGDDFWGLVSQVPADVLHEIKLAEAGEKTLRLDLNPFDSGNRLDLPLSSFQTDILARTGVDDSAAPGGQRAGAGVGIKGQFGGTEVDFRGSVSTLSSGTTFPPNGGGP